MATLVRQPKAKPTESIATPRSDAVSLDATVPSPFPQQERVRLLQEATSQSTNASDTTTTNTSVQEQVKNEELQPQEILPSIAVIQRSCITALVDLLLPPSATADMPYHQPYGLKQAFPPSSSRLQEIVHHLRRSRTDDQMTEAPSAQSETELIRELQRLVIQRSAIINPEDAVLAQTLVSLLAHFDRLTSINSIQGQKPERTSPAVNIQPPSSNDLFDVLRHQVNNLQIERLNTLDTSRPGTPPMFAVESALLWSRIDQDLEDVLAMCRQRTDTASFAIPPEYENTDELPGYEDDGKARHSFDNKSLRSTLTTDTNEKMRLDLEAVTSAIDRLYVVLPQLHNQRVEIKDGKRRELEQLERERRGIRTEGDDARELEKMLGLISKASERKLVDQSVIIDGGDMEARMHRARQREFSKRQSFNAQLAEYSGSGRLHGQDAILRSERESHPETLLSLPEFMREPMPSGLKKGQTLEADISAAGSSKSGEKKKSFQRLSSRTRSLSSPSLNWLLPSTSRSTTPVPDSLKSPPLTKGKGKRPASSGGRSTPTTPDATLSPDISYVAEFHENLRQVRAFITLTGLPTAAVVEAQIDDNQLDIVHLRCGDISFDLKLPAKAASAGPLNVQWTGTYYELKTATRPNSIRNPFSDDAESKSDMLGAPHLTSASPTSFACASCSLPLVQASKVTNYRDLPSEYWAELVEAWMCHSDQKLNKQIMQHANGFEPEAGWALVSGSYILFNRDNVVTGNLVDYEQSKRLEDWYTIRCICGSIVGRRRDVTLPDGEKSMTYRLAKYSIRALSSTTHITPVPLTTFVVEDMIELQQAHASYRFIILDEEEERPRLLIWLFKPSLRLAYAAPTQYQIPRTGSITCAKILFRILGPEISSSELTSILNKHPGFPQAEHLLYPIHVCRRLAGMLRESSTAYPDGLRTMTGLDVGWLPK